MWTKQLQPLSSVHKKFWVLRKSKYCKSHQWRKEHFGNYKRNCVCFLVKFCHLRWFIRARISRILCCQGLLQVAFGLPHLSGWMKTDSFVEGRKDYTAGHQTNPAFLILDNHKSHLSIEALDLAKNRVSLFLQCILTSLPRWSLWMSSNWPIFQYNVNVNSISNRTRLSNSSLIFWVK